MTKAEIIEAINATIAPNGVKGITAESLANILTEMVNATPEGGGGSGDGALRVIVPEMQMLGREIINSGELSPTSWEAMKPQMEAGMGFDLSEYDAVVKASFAHNANVAQQILDKARAGQGVSVVLDQTPYTSTFISILFQVQPDMESLIEEAVMSGVQPTGLSLEYMKPTPEGEALLGGGGFACTLVPTGYFNDTNSGIGNYPSDMAIALSLDGSLTFTQIEEEEPSSGSGVVTFYFAMDEGELSDEYKAKNVSSFNTFKVGCPVTIIGIVSGDEVITMFPVSVSSHVGDQSGLNFLACNFPMKTASGKDAAILFYEDGSMMIQM